jgi:AmiR/NasT family two-component response regulator
MRQSEHARRLARLETMPVIEQAKGIIMARSHCGDAEAFELLRRASQRSNLPVRELAAQIVAKTAQAHGRRAPPPAD